MENITLTGGFVVHTPNECLVGTLVRLPVWNDAARVLRKRLVQRRGTIERELTSITFQRTV